MPIYPDAQSIFDALARAGLLDYQGEPTEFSQLETEGRRDDVSNFSGDEIPMYYVEITLSEEVGTYEENARWMTDYGHLDESNLLCIATGAWSILVRQGAPDAEIPLDIDDQIRRALSEGAVVWKRPIPAPRWFEMPFATASELLSALDAVNFHTRRVPLQADPDRRAADAYILESVDDDTFATAVLYLEGERGTSEVRLQVFIDEHWAAECSGWLDHYFPITAPSATAGDDGWAVRVVAGGGVPLNQQHLQSIAAHIDKLLAAPQDPAKKRQPAAGQAATVSSSPVDHAVEQRSSRFTTAAFERDEITMADVLGATTEELMQVYGPQTVHFDALLRQIWDLPVAAAERFGTRELRMENQVRSDALHKGVALASFAGRELGWGIIMHLTRPEADSPSWYARARMSDPPDAYLTQVGAEAYFAARCALQALLLRDLLLDRGEAGKSDYLALTRPWRTCIAKVHPDDE